MRERNTNTDIWPNNFRAGMWAWLIQRLTGLIIAGYLFLHIFVISSSIFSAQGEAFNAVLGTLGSKPFIIVDLLLLAVILYHALNGIRVLLFDIGVGVRSQKPLFWSMMAVVVVLEAAAAYLLLPLLFAATA
jgi:succinate dehydrogenase / fumarate reductase cytochrome b subunit